MYTVCVRDHMMIAHSFSGEVFGPAQRLHGATYVVDVEFRRRELDADGIVVDIGLAGTVLHDILARHELPQSRRRMANSPGRNTTTEFLARTIFERLAQAHPRRPRWDPRPPRSCALRVTLHESHVAWACLRGRARGPMSARALEFVVPGDLEAATGGYGYDRRIISGLRALGWQVTRACTGCQLSCIPPPLRSMHAQQVLAQLPDQALVLVDGLAAGAMPQLLRAHAARLRLVALVHHPLAAESGLAAHRALELRALRAAGAAGHASRHRDQRGHQARPAILRSRARIGVGGGTGNRCRAAGPRQRMARP